MSEFLLSPKYKVFLKHKAPVEFLEGTTYAGKTTVGVPKFMFMVAKSEKKQHILSGLDLGTISKNIITKDNGILDIFDGLVEFNPDGKGKEPLPHLLFKTSKGDKIIYLLGYADKARWKKALGGQYGCLYIDEINTADMDFVREASMRCDYLIATLNPDDPNLPIYSEYINHARPLPQYVDDAPKELNDMLIEEPKPGWTWWFFSFKDNLSLTEEKKNQIISNVPVGTKLYKNKIQGLRGRATGLIFINFDRRKHIVNAEFLKNQVKLGKIRFKIFSSGLDTAYSSNSPDTIAFTFQGITTEGVLYYLDEEVYNNADLSTPLAPSDIIVRYYEFLERNRAMWGFAKTGYIDSADQATITEARKYKRNTGCVYNFEGAWKKTPNIDRINLQLGWIATGHYFVLEHCKKHIQELESYSWKEDKNNEPEDGHDHTIQSNQYGWLPFKDKIGIDTRVKPKEETLVYDPRRRGGW